MFGGKGICLEEGCCDCLLNQMMNVNKQSLWFAN